jgi:uncharacterized phage protein (TIGR01671 family)
MAREIKFRGMRIDNEEWTVGDLINLHDGRRFIIDNKFGASIDGSGNFINTEAPFVNQVLPETIGQLVGIKNEFGFDIYEGDIIHSDQWQPTTYQVCYDRGAFYIAGADKHEVANIKYAEGFKVIGNIHENPELINF